MPGLIARMRQAWYGPPGSPNEPETPTSPKKNPWREVFDPNTNPNMKRTGRDFYDVPEKDQKSVWEYHVEADKAASSMKEAAFGSMASSKDYIDSGDLRRMFDQDRVDRIMRAADKNGDGRIDYQEFCRLLRQGS